MVHPSHSSTQVMTTSSSSPLVPFTELNFALLKADFGYFCPICKIRCNDKTSLRNHYRVHSGEKPFACPICNYRARQKGNLKLHMANHK